MRAIMNKLTISEEILLTTIWRLKDNAYGVTIRKKIAEIAKKDIIYGTLYNLLGRLVKKGYVTKTRSQPIKLRGGRSRMYYALTPSGIKALNNARELHKSIWEGLPEVPPSKRQA